MEEGACDDDGGLDGCASEEVHGVQHSASAIAVERPTTTAHSDASWQHCSQTTGACLATMVPSLPGGHTAALPAATGYRAVAALAPQAAQWP